MRISDWSSDVCSSDLHRDGTRPEEGGEHVSAPVGRRGRAIAYKMAEIFRCHSGSRFAPDSAGIRHGKPRYPESISRPARTQAWIPGRKARAPEPFGSRADRKSTRLNTSH